MLLMGNLFENDLGQMSVPCIGSNKKVRHIELLNAFLDALLPFYSFCPSPFLYTDNIFQKDPCSLLARV